MPKKKVVTSDAIKELKNIETELESLNKAKKELGNKVTGMLKNLINKTDLIEAVRWTQYTPYFNDGEACLFSVNDIQFKFSDKLHDNGHLNKSKNDDFDDDGFTDQYDFDTKAFFDSKREVVNYKDIDALESLTDDIAYAHSVLSGLGDDLKEILGDHVQVTVTRKGIETEEYSHD